MTKWHVENAWMHDPRPGSDRDYAKSFVLSDGRRSIELTVEYAAPSSLAGSKHAEGIVRTFLDDDSPPRLVLVDRQGQVTIIEPAPSE
jgi:hypothetical protein